MRNLIRALIATLALVLLPVVSQAGLFVGVSVNIAPPVLPVYVQPPCPAPGYIWIPGYWAWDDDYYWVPGTWVVAPAVGLLWTPGYWGWADGVYVWSAGYWGPHVGFYGGIDYGFGYTGVGYQGGYWRGSQFYYNRSVTNINTTNITNVYNRTVVNNVNVTRVSFNGGAGGVAARPTAAELSAQHERHLEATPVQRQQQQLAERNSSLRATANGGRPAIAATPRAGVFSGHGVVAARGAEHAGTASRASGAPPTGAERTAPHASASRSVRPTSEQHTAAHESAPARSPPVHETATARAPVRESAPAHAPVHETAPAHAPQPQHYASVQPNLRSPEPHYQPQPAPHYQPQPAPHYQPQPAPHYQPQPAPHYQPQPAPHQQAAAPQGASRNGHEAQRPEHGGGEHGG